MQECMKICMQPKFCPYHHTSKRERGRDNDTQRFKFQRSYYYYYTHTNSFQSNSKDNIDDGKTPTTHRWLSGKDFAFYELIFM